MSGGYYLSVARERGCALPPDLDPISPSRTWAGLQFNANPRDPVNFIRGVSVPQLG